MNVETHHFITNTKSTSIFRWYEVIAEGFEGNAQPLRRLISNWLTEYDELNTGLVLVATIHTPRVHKCTHTKNFTLRMECEKNATPYNNYMTRYNPLFLSFLNEIAKEPLKPECATCKISRHFYKTPLFIQYCTLF